MTIDMSYKKQMELEKQDSFEDGKKEGIEQGMEQGMARKALQVYQNCIQRGFSKEEAIAISGIDEKDVPN